MKKLKIDMISESEFTVKGHGVHTAYLELTNALKRRDDTDVAVNTARDDADIVHAQTVGLYSVKHLLRRGPKKVITAHVIGDSFVGSIVFANIWKPLGEAWLRFVYSRADLVLAVSKMVQDELRREGLKHVELFYNSVDMSKYRRGDDERQRAREALGISAPRMVVGNGQVQPRKRLDIFFDTARVMPDTHFVWVGGIPFKHLGADYRGMQQLIQSAPANVTVTGVIPLEKVRDYLMAADAFFLPSDQENHPMCVLEAAGADLPILLHDIPEYNDTFRGNVIMITSAAQAHSELSRLFSDQTAYDEAVRQSRIVADKFDSATGAERAMAFYRQLLEDNTTR